MRNSKFDDIRPYYDSEIHAAMERIASDKLFPAVARYVFPDYSTERVREMILKYNTIEEFQYESMYALINHVIKTTLSSFTYSGAEHLDSEKTYLFMSNHRDIMMDAAFLQMILYLCRLRQTQITFGSNLMYNQLVTDIGRSNRMFTVKRGGSMRDFYKNSLQLSQYIRETITDNHESIWIAQRNGRTKDGIDATDQGIIKMLCMSDESNFVESLIRLNIAPIAVSYEIEPCIVNKTREIYINSLGQKYIKAPGEDFQSVLSGITDFKGDFNLTICEPLTKEEISRYSGGSVNELFKGICSIIDNKIHKAYNLFSNNFIAYDILHCTDTFVSKYSIEQKEAFVQRFNSDIQKIEGDRKALSQIYLGIYANPVIAQL